MVIRGRRRRVLFLVLTAGVGASCVLLDGTAPEVAFDRDFEVLGRAPAIGLTVSDQNGGVARVRVALRQGDAEVVLVDDTFADPEARPTVAYALGDRVGAGAMPQEGAARFTIDVADGSLRGNQDQITYEFEFDLYPPRLEVLSGLVYVNHGGAEMALYRVSEDAAESGVRVGEHVFPGYPANFPDDAEAHFALFAFSYDTPVDTPVSVFARDATGNESLAGVAARVAPRQFRSREIVIDDPFLQKVVPEIMSRTNQIRDQGSLIDTYVEINSRLRQMNHAALAELASESAGEFLWDGGFQQLSNSQVESLFADHRTYLYQGREVDRQDHVGFDLSVVERYPIEATNSGRVLLAEYFGIYGNTVVIDHGAGLVSLYGHMSSIDVSQGQTVSKGQTLGRSGAIGLAGGDHLHFGMFIHGVPVNPIEWWDARWVQDHVLARLNPEPDPVP